MYLSKIWVCDLLGLDDFDDFELLAIYSASIGTTQDLGLALILNWWLL